MNDEFIPGKKDAQEIDKPALKYMIGDFILEMGAVLKYGEGNYAPNNWKNFPLNEEDFKDARLRHAFKEGNDDESGLSHLAHEAVNCMFQWWHERNISYGNPKVGGSSDYRLSSSKESSCCEPNHD